jgi:predicted nuclease of predicted toxin-antitoxin system
MKFIIDAQLPKRLARFLQSEGYDAVHTLDLPQQNATPDAMINSISVEQHRVVITKDADFVESFLLQGKPHKLLLIGTGNIKNSELEQLIAENLQQLVELLNAHSYIELNRSGIVVYQ